MKDFFPPKGKQFNLIITFDDDKHWYNYYIKHIYKPINENSKLKLKRHSRYVGVPFVHSLHPVLTAF